MSSSHFDSAGIRLTFVTNNIRGATEVYDTDSLKEALIQHAERHFDGDSNAGPEKWVFALVVERGDARYEDRQAVADVFHDIAMIEQTRAHR